MFNLKFQSVGLGASYIKIGGLNRSERVKKLNRLIEIEQCLSSRNLLIDHKELPQKTIFPTDFQIPSEFAETIHAYQQSLEDAKTQKPNAKK